MTTNLNPQSQQESFKVFCDESARKFTLVKLTESGEVFSLVISENAIKLYTDIEETIEVMINSDEIKDRAWLYQTLSSQMKKDK